MTWQVWRHRFRSSFTVWRSMEPAASIRSHQTFGAHGNRARSCRHMFYQLWATLLGNRLWPAAYCLWDLHPLSLREVKLAIDGLYKAFESRVRLGIMSALAVNDTLDFNALKEFLGVTDGNLASHIKALEKERFIGVNKSFVGRKPNTPYFITDDGKSAFEKHLKALEHLIKSQR